jgi:butyrate kinase
MEILNLNSKFIISLSLKTLLNGQGKIQRRSIKHWLNEDAASRMIIDRLKERNGYDEIKSWFTEIGNRANGGQ